MILHVQEEVFTRADFFRGIGGCRGWGLKILDNAERTLVSKLPGPNLASNYA
jgi:hypothetical protein